MPKNGTNSVSRGPYSFLPRNQLVRAEASPAVQQHAGQHAILLRRVHRHHVHFAAEARAADIDADEVRREQNRRGCAERAQVLQALDPHHALDAPARRPPQHPQVEDRAARGAKVLARDPLALAWLHLREAALQVDARYAPPFRNQPEHGAP
jgi:hypothetical protein